MKREKTLTKKERQALRGGPRPQQAASGQHIHCVACGKHLDPTEFRTGTAQWLRCQHGSQFASCTPDVEKSRELLAEHDRTGQPVSTAAAWH